MGPGPSGRKNVTKWQRAWSGWHEDLLDMGLERRAIDRLIDHARSGQPIAASSGEEGTETSGRSCSAGVECLSFSRQPDRREIAMHRGAANHDPSSHQRKWRKFRWHRWPVQPRPTGVGRGKCRWHRHRRPHRPGIQESLPSKKVFRRGAAGVQRRTVLAQGRHHGEILLASAPDPYSGQWPLLCDQQNHGIGCGPLPGLRLQSRPYPQLDPQKSGACVARASTFSAGLALATSARSSGSTGIRWSN
jgi:hypothetical protein